MAAKLKELLWYAECLALFANCEDEIAVKEFMAKNEEFFPPHFRKDASDRRATALPTPREEQEPEWMPLREELEPEWKPLQEEQEVVQVPMWWGFRAGLSRAWQEGFPADWVVILIALTHPKTSAEAWPYQRALMFLAVEPWRARYCGICGNRFVAEKPATRFCSAKCAGGARKKSRDAWWHTKGDRWRRKRQKRRTPTRGKR